MFNDWFESNTYARSIVLWQAFISYAADSVNKKIEATKKQEG